MYIFETTDYHNQIVRLDQKVWKEKLMDPVFGHPEIKPYRSFIKHVIQYPDYVYQSSRANNSKLLYRRIPKSDFTGYFLLVVVKYVAGAEKLVGYVSTVLITRKLPTEGKLLWEKAN